MADILRAGADAYGATRPLSSRQQRAVNDLTACRTAALGGFRTHCDQCGAVGFQYASCRNRHCPKCQSLAQTQWVERQCANLLDIDHWHMVFTLPHELNPLAQAKPGLVYGLLFKAASRTLLEFGRNPRWLDGEIGIIMVLHTWGQNLGQHVHVHCIVTDGGLSPDRERWLAPRHKGFLFPVRALSKVFRGKYLDLLSAARDRGELRPLRDADEFGRLKDALKGKDWVVYAKAPFSGTDQVLSYLGRYAHKTAITNHRLVDFDGEHVRFRWRDYAHGDKVKVMRLDVGEFIRRFLLHVLPKGFTRIRHYGLFANRCRGAKLARCRELLAQPEPEPREPESVSAMMLRLTGKDITVCERCGHGPLRQVPLPKASPETAWQAPRPRPPP